MPALIPALLAALFAGVAPGYFWAACLRGRTSLTERIAFSIGLSVTLVPATALLLARLFSTGVTLAIAAVSVLAVFVLGLAVYLRFGPATEPGDEPLSTPSAPPGFRTLALVALVLALLPWAIQGPLAQYQSVLAVVLAAVLVAAAWFVRQHTDSEPTLEEPGRFGRVLWMLAPPMALALMMARGYLGPVLHEWPYIRGGDQFSYAVMANEMLSKGEYHSYLIYPPGFATLTAVVSRLSGLGPLEIFPAVAPALLVLPSLACYALARQMWGRGCGVAAIVFSGLLYGGAYANLEQGRYPHLMSAQFLLVLAVAALVLLYRAPTVRCGLLVAILGSSVVLYHSVGSFYLALLLALISVLILPYLLLRHRKEGLALFCSLALLGIFSVAFAWGTYDLPSLFMGLLPGSSGTGAGREAVSAVIGTQEPLSLRPLLMLASLPVLWLGILGAVSMIAVKPKLPLGLTQVTLLLWCALLYLGSRTAESGFPQRFESDLGVPLAVLASLALVTLLRSFAPGAEHAWGTMTSAVPLLALLLVGVQSGLNIQEAAVSNGGAILTPPLATAGEWLKEHNTGGNIAATPKFGNVPERAVLAMGGYTGLQSYKAKRVKTPRSLPPSGIGEIKDANWLLYHPVGGRTGRILKDYDIRYLVLSKEYSAVNWRDFEARSHLYRKVYENGAVVVLEPRTLNGS